MLWIGLVAGLLLLIFGADLLVRGAAQLAGRLRIPALVIGLTVVAFGTSAPELAVSVKSAWSGQAELAIANVVGSNTFNILFILGLAALVSPLVVSHQLIRRDVPIMIAVSVVAVVMAMNGSIGRWESAVLLAGLLVYTGWLFYQARNSGAEVVDDDVGKLLRKPGTVWQNLALVIGGLALLVLGARWLVNAAVSIASSLGVSEAVIGLTIVAAGTSLPEVMTSVIATFKGQRDIAIGNVVGSNIFNILSVLGLSGLISPLPLLAGAQLVQLDLPIMLGVAALCLPLFFTGAILSRLEGVLFLVLYFAYVWYMVAVAMSHAYVAQLQAALLYGLAPAVALFVVVTFMRQLRKSAEPRDT